ncbi:MAG: DUF2254 domain-containing protein [Polyangiaceae bacterium]|nr:DUF2254 domain-containing protein [Polyangiaceae bacterium]
MSIRHLREALSETFWLVLVVAIVGGGAAGVAAARMDHDDSVSSYFGRAWLATSGDARGVLGTLFGLQITVLTIVLSVNASTLQAGANQYSPRLVPFYLKNTPLRRTIPMFAFSAAYTLAATKTLGMITQGVERPRPAVTGAIALLLATFATLAIGMFKTFPMLRVERVLVLVRNAAVAAAGRLEARMSNLTTATRATLILPSNATPVRAAACGYIVDIDVERLSACARSAGVRVRICRAIGDYVDEAEVIGWAASDRGFPVDSRGASDLARSVALGPNRELGCDPLYCVRILADVAARALSSSSHDAYTARQALQQLRSVLRNLMSRKMGDWNVVDADGSVRVSMISADLREFISVGIDAPLRVGAGEPEVLDAVLEIALEIGLLASDGQEREMAFALVARVVEDAAEYGHLDRARTARLLAHAELVRTTLVRDSPRPDRHARSVWALMPQDEVDELRVRLAGATR